MRNLDAVSPLINVVLSQKGRLFSSQCTVIQHQNECLVSQRHGGKDIQEEIGKLALTGNPGSRWRRADQSSFLPMHALWDRVEEIMALSDPNTPIVEESNGAHVTADRVQGKVRSSDVGDVLSGQLVSRATTRRTIPEAVEVTSDQCFIGLKNSRERDFDESLEEIFQVPTVIVDGTWASSHLC